MFNHVPILPLCWRTQPDTFAAKCCVLITFVSPLCLLFFSSSSTFKDPERASLRDSGHGDSDQADSDQDTNKGSCCDMSAKEALKLKATGIKPAPLEQGEFSLAVSPTAQMNAEPRALGPTDYQLCFFSVLLKSDAATLFPSYFVLCTFLTLCACQCAYLRASERGAHFLHVLSLSKQTSPLCFYKPNYFSFSI